VRKCAKLDLRDSFCIFKTVKGQFNEHQYDVFIFSKWFSQPVQQQIQDGESSHSYVWQHHVTFFHTGYIQLSLVTQHISEYYCHYNYLSNGIMSAFCWKLKKWNMIQVTSGYQYHQILYCCLCKLMHINIIMIQNACVFF